jgi:hypothetical protein
LGRCLVKAGRRYGTRRARCFPEGQAAKGTAERAKPRGEQAKTTVCDVLDGCDRAVEIVDILVEVDVIKAADEGVIYKLVKRCERTWHGVEVKGDFDFDLVVVAVTVGVGALAEETAVFVVVEVRLGKAMACTELKAAGDGDGGGHVGLYAKAAHWLWLKRHGVRGGGEVRIKAAKDAREKGGGRREGLCSPTVENPRNDVLANSGVNEVDADEVAGLFVGFAIEFNGDGPCGTETNHGRPAGVGVVFGLGERISHGGEAESNGAGEKGHRGGGVEQKARNVRF